MDRAASAPSSTSTARAGRFRFAWRRTSRRRGSSCASPIPSLPFSGTWTYELRPSGSGTELTLTEDGEVANPIFRVMQKLFFSPYGTIDTYLADLQKRVR